MPRGIGKPRPTQARIEWLEHLERVGSAKRQGGPTGCWCMRFGWTRWLDESDPARGGWSETLTDDGREVLRQWRLP